MTSTEHGWGVTEVVGELLLLVDRVQHVACDANDHHGDTNAVHDVDVVTPPAARATVAGAGPRWRGQGGGGGGGREGRRETETDRDRDRGERARAR